MNMIDTETIACPACKVEQDVDVYQTINAMENLELVQKLMAGEISIFTCTACSHVAQIHTPLLFNDHRMDLKIQFYPEHLLVENPEYVVMIIWKWLSRWRNSGRNSDFLCLIQTNRETCWWYFRWMK
jgi:hypothetical protein